MISKDPIMAAIMDHFTYNVGAEAWVGREGVDIPRMNQIIEVLGSIYRTKQSFTTTETALVIMRTLKLKPRDYYFWP